MSFQAVMSRIQSRKVARNISRSEWCAIKSFQNVPLKIIPSDKGGDFCICDVETYKNAVLNHLSEASVYRQITYVDASKVEERVNLLWKSICRRRTINKGVEIMYCTTASRIAVFKGLIKTHKGLNQIKIRPVVNTIGSPTYKISWLLQKILGNVLPRPRFSQKSSDDIIKDIMEKRFNNETEYTYPFSLDVVSMYTSIPAQQAVDNFCQRLADHDFVYFGVTPSDFRELFMMVLNNSYFQFEKRFYKQIIGLPMGNKISGLLADFYMDSVEQSLVNSLSIKYQ
jgi:hypothetical protein